MIGYSVYILTQGPKGEEECSTSFSSFDDVVTIQDIIIPVLFYVDEN